jgi:hypothetical protein
MAVYTRLAVPARQDAGRVYGTLDEHPVIEE